MPRVAALASPCLRIHELDVRFFESVVRESYAGWCDEPIPVLGDRAPRACLASRRGREQVRALLRSYEEGERAQAAAQGRRIVSYAFLWEELGLARDE